MWNTPVLKNFLKAKKIKYKIRFGRQNEMKDLLFNYFKLKQEIPKDCSTVPHTVCYQFKRKFKSKQNSIHETVSRVTTKKGSATKKFFIKKQEISKDCCILFQCCVMCTTNKRPFLEGCVDTGVQK
jgi:hypothetical protein